MPLQNSKWPAAKRGHRTNSLGSAKVDCHTCLQSGSRCDRQRPRCGTCVKSHQECGGFKMDLVWKNPKRTVGSRQSHANVSEHLDSSKHEPRANEGCERQFKFVQGRRRIKRKPQRVGQDLPAVDGGNFSIPSTGFYVLEANDLTPKEVSLFGDSSPSDNSNAEWCGNENEARKLSSSFRFL
jgi:hypothetical protein